MRRIVAVAVALGAIAVVVAVVFVSGPGVRITVPDVVGKPYAEGTRALKAAGFRLLPLHGACFESFASTNQETLVVSRIRRDGQFLRGGVDQAPKGAKLALDMGIQGSEETVCAAVTPRPFNAGPLLGALWVSSALVAAVYAGRDMRRRRENGGIWGLIVFLLFPLGLLFWLAVRADKPLVPGASVEMRRDAEAFSPFESSDRG